MKAEKSQLPYAKVGIGMPVYNGETFLEESILANLKQTFADFHLVISDNASTDKTREICEDYALQDKRIHYIHNPVNLGASKNYTACFEPSNCQYFRWSNADDLLAPTQIEKCVDILDSNPDVVLAYGKTMIIDDKSNITDHYDDNLDLQQESAVERFIIGIESIGLSNVLYGLMRRDQLAKTALLGSYVASDINLILELALYGKFHELPEFLFSRRMHAAASSWDRSDSEVQREFWDPSKKKMWFQLSRSIFEYFKAVSRAPIGAKDKRKIFFHLIKNIYWEKEKISSEIYDYSKYNTLKWFKK